MIEYLKYGFVIVASILMGVFATFLVLLNFVKSEEERAENENGETGK